MPKAQQYALVTENEAAKGAYNARVDTMEKDMFIQNSSLEFSRTFDVFGPAKGEAPAIVFVHGGGGCRAMFLPHAREFSKKGYRCVLLDLPGHGARMDEELTLQSSIDAIVEVTRSEAPPTKQGQKPFYFGGSLGGYIGMELLGQHPDMFAGAIIAMCGQCVGIGAGIAARLGLKAMQYTFSWLSPATTLGLMRSAAKKNGHISSETMLEISLRPGAFFHQGKAMVDVLRASNPTASLPNFSGPMLFVNGSRDHRDSEQRWVGAAKQGRLEVYTGGDHFFSHDERFFQRFVADSLAFVEHAYHTSV